MPKDPLKVLACVQKCAEQKCWSCPTVREVWINIIGHLVQPCYTPWGLRHLPGSHRALCWNRRSGWNPPSSHLRPAWLFLMDPSLTTGTGTVDCELGLWPQGDLVIVRPLMSCENDAFVDLHPFHSGFKLTKVRIKGQKRLKFVLVDLCFHFQSERFILPLAKFLSSNENRNFTGS